jgi:hypothetical protein
MRLTRVSLAAVALLALSACATQQSPSLPDEPSTEASGGQHDRNIDTPPKVVDAPARDQAPATPPTSAEQTAILARYPQLDPNKEVPRNLLATALRYFEDHSSSVKNKSYVAVIDFSLPSTTHRFWIINMASGSVFGTTVAHGKNSDKNNDGFAEAFSNQPNSDMSSLGIYLTAETYSGAHGLSLRLDGMSVTNSNVRARAVVIHGADYVQDKNVRQGRSWGCPAVPMAYRDKIIGMIKGGTVIYAGLSAKE